MTSANDAKQKRSQLKREAILDAAIECIASLGASGLTFDEVSRRTGLSRSHLIYYFKNHAALLDGVFFEVAASARGITMAGLEGLTCPKASIESIADSAVIHLKKHPSHSKVLLLFFHYCTVDQNKKKLLSDSQKIGQQRLALYLAKIYPNQTIESHLEKASMIQTIITGYLVRYHTTNLWTYREVREKLLREVRLLIA